MNVNLTQEEWIEQARTLIVDLYLTLVLAASGGDPETVHRHIAEYSERVKELGII